MIKFNDKALDAISLAARQNTKLLTFEGTIRAGKTVIALQAFFYKVITNSESLHFIAGTDLETISTNLLESEFGLLSCFPEYCRLITPKIGAKYLEINYNGRSHHVKLIGYSNRSKWKKILGSTIGVGLIDEVNIADKQFVLESLARQVSVKDSLQIWTLNGDVPNHWIYQEYINNCKIIGGAPLSIISEMSKFNQLKGRYYFHFNFLDNPKMTEQQIEATHNLYPNDSYYYTIKILGERGAPGKMIYTDYLQDDCLVNTDEIDFDRFTIGVDIGFNAYTKIYLVGFTTGFQKVAAVDCVGFQHTGYTDTTKKIIELINKWKLKINNIRIDGVYVDSAEANYIIDLNTELRKINIDAIKSYKATIKERIALNIILMSQARLLVDRNRCKLLYNAFKVAKWAENKEGQEREDLNEQHNDDLDAFEYGETRFMKSVLSAAISNLRAGDNKNGTNK